MASGWGGQTSPPRRCIPGCCLCRCLRQQSPPATQSGWRSQRGVLRFQSWNCYRLRGRAHHHPQGWCTPRATLLGLAIHQQRRQWVRPRMLLGSAIHHQHHQGLRLLHLRRSLTVVFFWLLRALRRHPATRYLLLPAAGMHSSLPSLHVCTSGWRGFSLGVWPMPRGHWRGSITVRRRRGRRSSWR